MIWVLCLQGSEELRRATISKLFKFLNFGQEGLQIPAFSQKNQISLNHHRGKIQKIMDSFHFLMLPLLYNTGAVKTSVV